MLQAIAKLRLFNESACHSFEHIAVTWNTHDPFIYMDTFLGFLAKNFLFSMA